LAQSQDVSNLLLRQNAALTQKSSLRAATLFFKTLYSHCKLIQLHQMREKFVSINIATRAAKIVRAECLPPYFENTTWQKVQI